LRLIRGFVVGLALLAVWPLAAQAQMPACTGKNLLDELAATDAAAHARVMAAAAATENATAVLWRIEKAGIPPSYLFGTMHLTDERINALSPAVTAALAGSRRLVLELDDLSPGGFAKLLAESPHLGGLMMFTDGRRLEQMLGADDFAKLSAVLVRAGVPPPAAGLFRPWLATLLLAVSECEQRRMTSGLPSLDARLARHAEQKGSKPLGLETVEGQFRALAGVPEGDQIEMLKAGVRYYDRIDDTIETMVQLYLRRQLGAIWPLQLALSEKVGVAPQVFDSAERAMLVTRNIGMRDKALPYLAEGGAFIGVGALHLPGRQGLVALFREAGYAVTAVE
jgi:uncharacterized protein YbaP (TraB family)